MLFIEFFLHGLSHQTRLTNVWISNQKYIEQVIKSRYLSVDYLVIFWFIRNIGRLKRGGCKFAHLADLLIIAY